MRNRASSGSSIVAHNCNCKQTMREKNTKDGDEFSRIS